MSILFIVSIVCFCTLVWASLSIARHIRAHSHPGSRRFEDGGATPTKVTGGRW